MRARGTNLVEYVLPIALIGATGVATVLQTDIPNAVTNFFINGHKGSGSVIVSLGSDIAANSGGWPVDTTGATGGANPVVLDGDGIVVAPYEITGSGACNNCHQT